MRNVFFVVPLILLFSYSCSNNKKTTDNINQAINETTSSNPIVTDNANTSIEKTGKSININWRIRKIPPKNEVTNSICQIYLYDSITKENHYITTLHVDSSLVFSKGDSISMKRDSILSLSTLSSDGQSEQGCSIFLEDSEVNTYFYYIGNGVESSLSLKSHFKINKDDKLITLSEEYIGIPKFNRVLQVENPPLYGDDISYIQALLEDSFVINSYQQFVDGYYGALTEKEVRNIQLKYRIEATGIVDQTTWEKIEKM